MFVEKHAIANLAYWTAGLIGVGKGAMLEIPPRFRYTHSSLILTNASLVPRWNFPACSSIVAVPPGCHSSTLAASYTWASQYDSQLRKRNSYTFPIIEQPAAFLVIMLSNTFSGALFH